jgi:prolyl 4-hydroxylase
MKKIDIKIEKAGISASFKETQYPHFIGSWDIEKETLCKEIINLFEENKQLQKSGVTIGGKDLTIKKTTDIRVSPNDLKNIRFKCLNNYIGELHKCFIDYQNQWPFIKGLSENIHIGAFNIQKYLPGDHFAKIHTERFDIQTLHRAFAWMTYLNDVDDGGATNFSHYDIKIKPKTGQTLIWPADWTHAHSGEILNSGAKYIVTGWMHFPHDKDQQE